MGGTWVSRSAESFVMYPTSAHILGLLVAPDDFWDSAAAARSFEPNTREVFCESVPSAAVAVFFPAKELVAAARGLDVGSSPFSVSAGVDDNEVFFAEIGSSRSPASAFGAEILCPAGPDFPSCVSPHGVLSLKIVGIPCLILFFTFSCCNDNVFVFGISCALTIAPTDQHPHHFNLPPPLILADAHVRRETLQHQPVLLTAM